MAARIAHAVRSAAARLTERDRSEQIRPMTPDHTVVPTRHLGTTASGLSLR